MDSARAFVQAAAPVLACSAYHANAMQLGIIGLVAQSLRLILCLISGRMSEKVGRTRLIVPSAILMALAAFGLTHAHSLIQIAICYTLAIVSLGAFYPPLQALIGDVSKVGELTKNLGAFNFGWCLFSAVAGLTTSAYLRKNGNISAVFYLAIATAIGAAMLVKRWKKSSPLKRLKEQQQPIDDDQAPKHLLTIARIGLVASFFGWGIIAMLFPNLAKQLGWTDAEAVTAVAMLMFGQFVGMLIVNASPWWRGKIWPQVMAQSIMMVCALIVAFISNQLVLDAAIFVIGSMISIIYTAALYHGTSARKKLGKNTGIHESLLALGNVSGCFVGGIAANYLAPRAPYMLFAGVLLATLLVTAVLSNRQKSCIIS